MGEPLLPENQAYYERLAACVTDALDVDGNAAEATMAEIHADLLQAQQDGISAVDYFGQDPQTIGKQLVANLPHHTWQDWLRFALLAYAAPFSLLTWRYVWDGVAKVPLGTAALLGAVLPVAILIGLAIYRRGTFKRKRFRDSGIVVMVVCQIVLLPLSDLFPKIGRVALPSLLIGGVGFGMALILVGLVIWLGMHSWLVAALFSAFATLFAVPAVDALITLPGWWGRLMIPGMFGALLLVIYFGDKLMPAKWQAKAQP